MPAITSAPPASSDRLEASCRCRTLHACLPRCPHGRVLLAAATTPDCLRRSFLRCPHLRCLLTDGASSAALHQSVYTCPPQALLRRLLQRLSRELCFLLCRWKACYQNTLFVFSSAVRWDRIQNYQPRPSGPERKGGWIRRAEGRGVDRDRRMQKLLAPDTEKAPVTVTCDLVG